jgi:tetratricopeptide (TPR) repeat protein
MYDIIRKRKVKMKREHIKLVILVFGLFIYPASNTVHADLIALWEFDNGSVADGYGYNHGILNGYPDFSAGHANIDGALELSGNDYLSISNESNFDITDKITVAAWIKVNEFNKHWQAIVTKGDSAWRLARTSLDKTLAFHLTGVTSDNNWTHQNLGVEGNIEVEDGKWHHAVGVYDGSKIYLYIDGILDKALNASGTIAINDYEVYIGENAEHKGRCFDGLIDDVAIFDHALTPEQVEQLYSKGAASFIPKTYMTMLVKEAKNESKDLGPQKTIVFLEKKIAEYQEWRTRNIAELRPDDEQLSSDIYVLLARAKTAVNAPVKDVIATYKQAVLKPSKRSEYVPSALLWLFEKTSRDEYVEIIKDCLRNSSDPFYHIYRIARYFESSGNWAAFKLFLDIMFLEMDDVTPYARVVAKGLEDNGVWAKKFLEYCRNKPELTEYLFYKHEKIARNYTVQKNFQKAIEIYGNIIEQCGPNQDKSPYEFKVYECLFNDQKYENVIPKLENFVRNKKGINRTLVSEAIILEGQAYIQLGDIDQAREEFLTLLIEYPETKQAPDANFFVGYCYMLQGKFNEAVDAFNLVVKDYPESSYVDKALSNMSRIKSMTE